MGERRSRALRAGRDGDRPRTSVPVKLYAHWKMVRRVIFIDDSLEPSTRWLRRIGKLPFGT